MAKNTPDIIILGAGYAGIMAAVRLAGKAKRANPRITLINAHARFVERPRLHEKATGTMLHRKPISDMLLGHGITFLKAWATRIDPSRRTVRIESDLQKQDLPYDSLVIALGSRVERRLIPGVDEFAFTLDPDGNLSTDDLKNRLEALESTRFRAVVVGGGATGVEAAAQIKGIFPDSHVRLVTKGAAGAFKGERIQKHILTALREQAIEVLENTHVQSVNPDGIQTGSGTIPADIVLWAGGFTASPLAREAGLETNAQNQVLVDPYLRSISHPEVFAVGDAACPVKAPGAPWRMSLFTALVSGAQAADNITAAIQGKTPRPLSYAWYGQAVALGPADAVGFSTYPVDIPWRLVFRRMPAVQLRRFFVWYLKAALEIERRVPGAFIWNGRGRYAKKEAGRHKIQLSNESQEA